MQYSRSVSMPPVWIMAWTDSIFLYPILYIAYIIYSHSCIAQCDYSHSFKLRTSVKGSPHPPRLLPLWSCRQNWWAWPRKRQHGHEKNSTPVRPFAEGQTAEEQVIVLQLMQEADCSYTYITAQISLLCNPRHYFSSVCTTLKNKQACHGSHERSQQLMNYLEAL